MRPAASKTRMTADTCVAVRICADGVRRAMSVLVKVQANKEGALREALTEAAVRGSRGGQVTARQSPVLPTRSTGVHFHFLDPLPGGHFRPLDILLDQLLLAEQVLSPVDGETTPLVRAVVLVL